MGEDLNSRASDWILIIIMAAGILLILARYFNAERIPKFFAFPWQAQADEFAMGFNAGKMALNADRILVLIAWIAFPVLITSLKMKGDSALILDYDWASYFRILLLGGLYLVLKLLVSSSVAYAFEREQEIGQAQNIAIAHFTWGSLVGAAMAFLFHYLPASQIYFFLILIPLLLLALLFLFRILTFCLRAGFSLSYIILYLCALEIIPLVFLYRLV